MWPGQIDDYEFSEIIIMTGPSSRCMKLRISWIGVFRLRIYLTGLCSRDGCDALDIL
jgi:hypothetical protein